MSEMELRIKRDEKPTIKKDADRSFVNIDEVPEDLKHHFRCHFVGYSCRRTWNVLSARCSTATLT